MKIRSLAGLCSAVVVSALVSVVVPSPGAVADPPGATFTVLGQPNNSSDSLATRCAGADARFNRHDFGGGFATAGPTGVVVTPSGRLFALDDGGQRVLSWPDADALSSCQAADKVIGTGNLNGPEGLTVGPDDTVYVADTLQHVVQIYTPDGFGDYPATPQVVLGESYVSGTDGGHFDYPRGLTLDDDGRLLVADDYNNKIKIFYPPFTNGQFADDSIGAGNNGGFNAPKDIAFAGGSLFVADFYNQRVLRFPGPFDNPATTYTADASFLGVSQPVNLTVGGDGTLFVTDGGNGGAPSVKSFPGATIGGSQNVWTEEYTFGGLLTGPSPDNGAQPEPLGVAVTPAGRLIVADYAGYRLVIETPANVGGGFEVVTTTLLHEYVQTAYKAQLTASGGNGRVKWSLTGVGFLPSGMKLSRSGKVTGRPTEPGTYTFEVLAQDATKPTPQTDTGMVTIEILPMEIYFNDPSGDVGEAYKAQVRSFGGKGVKYSLIGGALPPGLKMSPTGKITGKPLEAGTFSVDVYAVDKGTPQNSAHTSFDIHILP
ncbi:putative Ig domain-containing protein [Nocardioides humilatus]|uniref:putative Ig domain-containing protein n=1 Tax=Nocardioides humilatus TaxID=2607660 RepID=UPI00165EE7EE|nr:putative Ig domain-containing protein [Nocardioides humilatus]